MRRCSGRRQVRTTMPGNCLHRTPLITPLRRQPVVSQTLLVLLVILAQGIVRLAVCPLWAHYDESSHYEALRMMTMYGQMPTTGEMDPMIFKEIESTFTGHSIELCPVSDQPVIPGSICLRPGQQS